MDSLETYRNEFLCLSKHQPVLVIQDQRQQQHCSDGQAFFYRDLRTTSSFGLGVLRNAAAKTSRSGWHALSTRRACAYVARPRPSRWSERATQNNSGSYCVPVPNPRIAAESSSWLISRSPFRFRPLQRTVPSRQFLSATRLCPSGTSSPGQSLAFEPFKTPALHLAFLSLTTPAQSCRNTFLPCSLHF